MSTGRTDRNPHATRVLVDLAQGGDSAALNDLLERYHPRILRVVRMKRGPFLGQRLEDGDLAQEVMVRVWRSIEQYDPKQTANFLLWVTRVAENALRDLARRQLAAKRNPGSMLSLEEERERGTPDAATHPLSTSTPSRILGTLEDSQIVDSAVCSLSDDIQRLLILRYYFDLPLEDVGEHFQLGAEAVRSRIRRCLEKLRPALEQRGVIGAHDPERVLRRSF